MTLSMYQASVPVFLRAFGNLTAILKKAAAHAEEKKIDPSALLQARLFPDMFPLARQVQIATDTAKGCAARLAGLEPPRYEDTEAGFAELLSRIEKTCTYVQSVTPEQIDGSEARPVSLKLRGQTVAFSGAAYLLNFALPNFFFHVTTAYDILRHNGVQLGKQDYLGAL